MSNKKIFLKVYVSIIINLPHSNWTLFAINTSTTLIWHCQSFSSGFSHFHPLTKILFHRHWVLCPNSCFKLNKIWHLLLVCNNYYNGLSFHGIFSLFHDWWLGCPTIHLFWIELISLNQPCDWIVGGHRPIFCLHMVRWPYGHIWSILICDLLQPNRMAG